MRRYRLDDRRELVRMKTNRGRDATTLLLLTRPRSTTPYFLQGDAAQDYSRRQIAEAEAWREVIIFADFGRPCPVEPPATRPP